MFRIHIGNTPHSLNDRDFEDLARRTEKYNFLFYIKINKFSYSGSDIAILVRNALMEPVRACQQATHFKRVSGPNPNNPNEIVHDLLTPCSPGEPGAIEMTLADVPSDKLYPPTVSKLDFIKALETSRPSVSRDDLISYEKFTSEFGQEG